MVSRKVHFGKDNKNVPDSRRKSSQQQLSSPVNGSDGSSIGESPSYGRSIPWTDIGPDGSSIGESSSSGDSSISVNSHIRKKPRGPHGQDKEDLQGRKGHMLKAAEKIEEQNSNLPSGQASATTNANIKSAEIKHANKVTIRAKHVRHDHSIKFQLFWPCGLVELKQEVAKRLREKGKEKIRADYIIQYKDENNVLILMACDDDLTMCVKTSIALHNKNVELLLN